MRSQNRVNSNGDVISNFSLAFGSSELLMKIKFSSYVTLALFDSTKIPELHNSGN